VKTDDHYWVRGRVVDRSGFPVGGVSVTGTIPSLRNSRAYEAFYAITDEEGHFTLQIPREASEVSVTSWDPKGVYDSATPDGTVVPGAMNVKLVTDLR
jgi:hypothetical protein